MTYPAHGLSGSASCGAHNSLYSNSLAINSTRSVPKLIESSSRQMSVLS